MGWDLYDSGISYQQPYPSLNRKGEINRYRQQMSVDGKVSPSKSEDTLAQNIAFLRVA